MIKKLFSSAIYSSLKKSQQSIYKPLSMGFNTQVGSKKLLNIHDLDMNTYVELSLAIQGSHTTKMMAELMRDNLDKLTDYQLSFAIYNIWNNDLELDDHFYDVIIPIAREFIRNMNREHNKSLGQLAALFGRLEVKDKQLWQVFEQKLQSERLYRYLPLDQLIDTIHGMGIAGVGSPQLFENLEKVVVQQRLALTGKHQELAEQGFKLRGVGSPILFKVLENPQVDLKGLLEAQKKSPDQIQ